MKRFLAWLVVIFALTAFAILVVDAFKKANAGEVSTADPWQILKDADAQINNQNPAKNLRARVERGAQLLDRGAGWEGEARKELRAAADSADAVLKMLNPLFEKTPPYPPPVLARAYHMRAYAMLMKFTATLQIIKKDGIVEGREDRDLLMELDDIVSNYAKAVDIYAAPESVKKFTLEWVRDVVIPDIQKDLPALQQAQQKGQNRQQKDFGQQEPGPKKMDPEGEKEMMKIILGEKLGQNSKNIRIVPPTPTESDKRSGEQYSPGQKKLR